MCRVTILDEDFPGTIGFQTTEISVSKNTKEVEIEIERNDGSDGQIQCMVTTEPLTKEPSTYSAKEWEDYIPYENKVVFRHNETTTKVLISLCGDKMKQQEAKEFNKGI